MHRLHNTTRHVGLAVLLTLTLLAPWAPLLPQTARDASWRPPIVLHDTCPGAGEGDTCG